MRAAALISGFVFAAVVAASQSACIVPFECIYITIPGYQVCGNLKPVVSSGPTGEIEIIDADGEPPRGCSCMHPDTVEIFDANNADPQLAPIYEQIEADARVHCEELANQLLVDPSPCDTANISKGSTQRSEGPTFICKFVAETIDDDQDGYCPPYGAADEVGYTTEAGDSETDEGGVIVMLDLPFEPPP